jgi:HAT1-interacting factor 1
VDSEQFESAVEEYSSALSILSKTRSPSDRILSEQHLMIALALEFIPDQTSRSVSHAEKAKSVLVLRLNELESKGDEADEKEKKEIQNLKELIVDVDNKVSPLCRARRFSGSRN